MSSAVPVVTVNVVGAPAPVRPAGAAARSASSAAIRPARIPRMSADGSIAVTDPARPSQITVASPVPAPRSTTSGRGRPHHCAITSATSAGGRGRAAS